jgi:excisionase family DNA binding protein
MDSLAEWYRYVDEVSRPARRLNDEVDEAPADRAWRPWRAAADAPDVPEALSADAIPDLVVALGGAQVEAMHPATVEYVDPTLHDTLRPIPTFSAPELKAPTFELRIPRLGEQPAAAPEAAPAEEAQPEPAPAPAAATAPPAEVTPETEAAPEELAYDADAGPEDETEAGGEEDDGGADGQPMRYWDLLSQIRSHDVAQNSYKSPFRETREELVQRLLDPPLTLEEAARLLGVCPTTVRRYTNKGQLRHFRTTGNQRRFRLSDVLEFLESRASEIEADARADREAGLQ